MIRVVELFAGVGGFRVGLNNVDIINNKVKESRNFKIVFFNQWEPSSSIQHAYKCYVDRFNEKWNSLNNTDITKIDKNLIPDHDLLVGGFPCQDYSVARTLNGEKGIEGKKGILWWEIYKTLKVKKSKFVLLENVDRLLISPKKQRGRNFAIMLKCFDELGYFVEWKIINAAEYGMPQKRKRIFIFACKKNTKYFKHIKNNLRDSVQDFLSSNSSFFTKNFNCEILKSNLFINLEKDISKISNDFSCEFYDSGLMFDSKIYTFKTKSIYSGKKTVLRNIILNSKDVDSSFFITNESKLKHFKYLKGSKVITRTKNGYQYKYTEGKMSFPENLELPGRTMLTSEGSINRSTHVIEQDGNYRYLTPIECERLNMFPDNWTKIDNISNKTRNFLMGNALVCGIISILSKDLKKIINMETKK